jgi:hypothetical protein
MAPKLGEGKSLRRNIKVYTVEGDVIFAMDSHGISFKAPGTKLGVYLLWQQVVEACDTPANVPSKHQGRPLDFLRSQATEHQKRMDKRLVSKLRKEAQERQ